MTTPARVACLTVPLFPLAARLRSEPELGREALVVVAGNSSAARVIAASRIARTAGVKPGATLAQARALVPKLVARPRDLPCERAAQESLIEVCERFSPRVEDAGEGTAYLDLTGLDRLYAGSADPELELARAALAAVESIALPARAGVAGSKLAARIAAGLPSSPVVVPAGEEGSFLAPLPLGRLAPEMDLATALERWGVRSVGDFARLPGPEVASRLGARGSELQMIARGIDPLPLIPREPPPTLSEGTDLEWPLIALEPFLFVGRAALERLCRRLEGRGLACTRLALDLRLEPDGVQERTLDLPAPTRDVKTLLTLIKLELEARPPGAPVSGFVLTAYPDSPREAQLSLYGPAALSPDKLAATLARLFALLGPDRIGTPRPPDGHRPEGFKLVEFKPGPPPETERRPRTGRGLLAVRILRPPVPLEVIVDGEEPKEIRATVEAEAAKQPRIAGSVRVASGPWGLEEGWWGEEPIGRDYWDVEIGGSGIYRIYRERESGEWFADGVYD
jgi:protein ImuB